MAIQPVSGEIKAQPLNQNFSYLDSKMNNISKGSPSGTYATVAALTTAFPAGNKNIYVVSADGKWYYWSDTAWTAGGTYQSTGIADDSINTKNLNTVMLLSEGSSNLIKTITTYPESYIDFNNGSLNVGKSPGYTATDFILLDNRYDHVIQNTNQQFALYNSQKKFLRGSQYADDYQTISKENALYMRMTFETANAENVMFVKISHLSPQSIVDSSLSSQKFKSVYLINTIENMFDKTSATAGYYVDYTNGVVKPLANFSVSSNIPVDSRYKYIGENGTEQLACYDKNGRYCGGMARLEDIKNGFPDGTTTIRITVRDSTLDMVSIRVNNNIQTRDLSSGLQQKIIKSPDQYDYLIAKSGGDFNTIRAALEYNDSTGGGLVFKIGIGNFELTEEYTQAEYTATTFFGWSNKYPITLIGASKTKTRLTCTLPTDLDVVHQARISSFHAFASYEMSNLYIGCTNGRYAIHNDNTNVRYARHEDIYCEKIGPKGYNQALGGGTWSNSIHTHKNCVFKTNFQGTDDIAVSYHTNKQFSFSSKIVFENCTSISNSQYHVRFGSLISGVDNIVELKGNRFSNILVCEETEALGTGYDFLFSGYGNKGPLTFNLKSQEGISEVETDFVENVNFVVVPVA